MALRYVARFATSAAKLEAYLARKLRERGWEGDSAAEAVTVIGGLLTRFIAAGYVNDEAYAQIKTQSLLRRGYGKRRIDQALVQAGIGEDVRLDLRAGVTEQRQAALALAKRRRLGPYGAQASDGRERERQMAAMLRAGHPLDMARKLVDAADVETAEQWACEGEQ